MGKKSLGLVTLALSNIGFEEYGSHLAALMSTTKQHPDWEFHLLTPGRMPIDQARNAAIQAAKNKGCDAIFFWDDDTLLEPDTINKLLDRMFPEDGEELDVITPAYFIRGDGFPMMAFKWSAKDNLDRVKDEDWEGETGLVRIDAPGNGCTLYNMKVFDIVKHPWFLTKPGWHTEDVYFFHKLNAAKPDYKCYLDMSVTCGHIVEKLSVDLRNYRMIRAIYYLQSMPNQERVKIIDEIENHPNVKSFIEKSKKEIHPDIEFYKGERDGIENREA